MSLTVATVAAALATLVAVPAAPALARAPRTPDPARSGAGWMVRHRRWWALLSGVAAWSFAGGTTGAVLAVGAAVATWVAIGRAESPADRRRRGQIRRDLPVVVSLFAAALRSGSAPGEAAGVVAAALPGPAADRLSVVASRLLLGGDPAAVWSTLAKDPDLAPLGRTLARSAETGAPVVRALERLGDDLARTARAEVEDRARAVGVKAAVPLGLCLLPAFVLLGIVPVVAGLLGSLAW